MFVKPVDLPTFNLEQSLFHVTSIGKVEVDLLTTRTLCLPSDPVAVKRVIHDWIST